MLRRPGFGKYDGRSLTASRLKKDGVPGDNVQGIMIVVAGALMHTNGFTMANVVLQVPSRRVAMHSLFSCMAI